MNALYTTLIIALLSALIATILGTAAAIGIQAMRKKMRTVVTGVTNIPMLNADIVTGISLMLLFIACRFSLGFKTILIAHITLCNPECSAKAAANERQHLRGRPGSWRFSVIRFFQSRIPGYSARCVLRFLTGIYYVLR